MRTAIAVFGIFLTLGLSAQSDVGILMMRNIPQHALVQPAHTFEGLEIGLPGVGFRWNHTGDAFKDAWSVENRKLIIDSDAWVDALDDENEISSEFDVSTFMVGWKTGNLHWSLGHSFRNRVESIYSKGLAEFIHYGNGPYVGETMDLGLELDWTSYSDLHFGLALEIADVSVGARVHYLSGAQWLNIEPGDLSLFTNEDIYQLQFMSDMEVRSSSFISAEDIDNLTWEFSGLETYRWFSRNHGFAFDIGASATVLESLTLEVSVLDMGFIQWSEVEVFTPAESFEFDGLDFDDIADLDSLSFNDALDSLNQLAGVEESLEEDVVINFQPRIILGAHWQPSEAIRLSAMYMNTAAGDRSLSTIALGAEVRPFKWWSLGLNTSNRMDRWNLGFHTVMDIAFVQLYFATDHVPGLFSLDGLASSSVRIGGNLRF
jgi:hypothetical protein